jgi:hypothetical protein
MINNWKIQVSDSDGQLIYVDRLGARIMQPFTPERIETIREALGELAILVGVKVEAIPLYRSDSQK